MKPDNPPTFAKATAGGPAFEKATLGGAATGKPLRSRHEAFCQYFVLGGNASDAAVHAGYEHQWAKNQGYRLARQPRIRARIAEIRSAMAVVGCQDAAVLMGKLEAVYQRALSDYKFHAAARCVELQGRLAGHIAPPRKRAGKQQPTFAKASAGKDDDFAAVVSGQGSIKPIPCATSGRRK
ncbi:MAG: terminase small subunit [Rhodospirillales bacterium]|nr:terminase small subunit [Rhodospirillales bacterium]